MSISTLVFLPGWAEALLFYFICRWLQPTVYEAHSSSRSLAVLFQLPLASANGIGISFIFWASAQIF